MDDIHPHRTAAWLRRGLLALLALAALLTAASALRDIRIAATQRLRWEQHPAVVTNTADPLQVELEVDAALARRLPGAQRPAHAVPFQEQRQRILLPQPPYAAYGVSDTVTLAQNPAQPQQVAVQDIVAQGLPPLVKLLWLAGLGVLAWLLLRARWAEDLTRSAGAWVPTAQTPLRAGAQPTAPPLAETRGGHAGPVFWTLLTGAITAAALGSAIVEHPYGHLEAGSAALVLLGLFGLALGTAAGSFTHRLQHDAAGLCDRDIFRTRRVPWKEIASLQRVNLAEAAQRRWDARPRRSGHRPASHWVWRIRDAQGHALLQLPEHMAPEPAFEALRQRIAERLPAAPQEDGESEDIDAGIDAFDPEADLSPTSILDRRHRGLLLGLAAMLLPFVLAAGYATWNSLWFRFAAARAEGTVVQRSTDDAPSVVVEYATPGGAALRTESGGSDFYADIAPGTRITVFHDPADPAIARLDLFLELWIAPMLLGGLLLLVLLAAVLIARGLTRPMRMPGRARRAAGEANADDSP